MVLHYNNEPEDGPVRVRIAPEPGAASPTPFEVESDSLMLTDYGMFAVTVDDRRIYYPERRLVEYEPLPTEENRDG